MESCIMRHASAGQSQRRLRGGQQSRQHQEQPARACGAWLAPQHLLPSLLLALNQSLDIISLALLAEASLAEVGTAAQVGRLAEEGMAAAAGGVVQEGQLEVRGEKPACLDAQLEGGGSAQAAARHAVLHKAVQGCN